MSSQRAGLFIFISLVVLVINCLITTTEGREQAKPRIKIGPQSQIQKSMRIHSKQGAFEGMKCCVTQSYSCLKDTDCCSNVCQHTNQIARKTRKPHRLHKASIKTPSSTLRPRAQSTRAPPSAHGTPGTPGHSRPVSVTHTNSRYPLNTYPLVGEKLVIAKGSNRALVLTHGGIRCNDYIREMEQSIVGSNG